MSKDDASRIEELFRLVDEVRGISFKVRDFAKEKEAKLFGGSSIGEESKPSQDSDGGIIGEATAFAKMAYANIVEVCDFLAKL